MLDSYVLVDKNEDNLGFIPKKNADELIALNKGFLATPFIFQLYESKVCNFFTYKAYIIKTDRYTITVENEKQNKVFNISFKKMKNVRALMNYINLSDIFFYNLSEEEMAIFKDIEDVKLHDYSDILISKMKQGEKRRTYIYKSYLDANHAVVLKNSVGQVHSHTWEFSLEIVSETNEFIIFSEAETLVNTILKPYQNVLLNQTEPFDKINPTTESIGEYFLKQIEEKMKEKHWKLLSFSISEAPNRIFQVK